MAGAKNRRQGTAAAAPEPQGQQHLEPAPVANGNGNAHIVEKDQPEEEEGPKENIFLFWPNIIGTNETRIKPILPP